MNRQNMRMIQGRCSLGLAFKASLIVLILLALGWERLNSNLPMKKSILTKPDFAHPTPTNTFNLLITTKVYLNIIFYKMITLHIVPLHKAFSAYPVLSSSCPCPLCSLRVYLPDNRGKVKGGCCQV